MLLAENPDLTTLEWGLGNWDSINTAFEERYFLIDWNQNNLSATAGQARDLTKNDNFLPERITVLASNQDPNFDDYYRANVYMDLKPVPEPATMLLICGGLVGFAGLRKKFKKM